MEHLGTNESTNRTITYNYLESEASEASNTVGVELLKLWSPRSPTFFFAANYQNRSTPTFHPGILTTGATSAENIFVSHRKEDIEAASAHDFPSFSEVHPDEMKDFIKGQQDLPGLAEIQWGRYPVTRWYPGPGKRWRVRWKGVFDKTVFDLGHFCSIVA